MGALTLRQIETFAAVMKTGGMTRAAELLDMSQPSVSRMVADLETAIGVRLFERAGVKLEPTDGGRALFREVERSFRGLTYIEAVAQSIRNGRCDRLDLVVTPSLIPMVAESLLAEFAATHPDVLITLEVEATRHGFEQRVAQDCDVGLTVDPLSDGALTVIRLGVGEAVCVQPSRSRGAAKMQPVMAGDLDGVRMVGFRPDGIFRQQVDRVLAQAGVSPIYVAEARTTAAVCQLAASLQLKAIVPASGFDPLAGGRLTARPFGPAVSYELLMVRSAHRTPTDVAAQFMAQAERLRDEGWPKPLARHRVAG